MTGISDQEARRLRRLFAHDVCKCGHERQAHVFGRVCEERTCVCQSYALNREVRI